MGKTETLGMFEKLFLNASRPDHVKRFVVLMNEMGISTPAPKNNYWLEC